MLHNKPMFGVAVDLAKAFDSAPVEITFRLFEKLGGSTQACVLSLLGMYTQLQRRFTSGAFVGESFRSTNGILQGCPLSVMLLKRANDGLTPCHPTGRHGRELRG